MSGTGLERVTPSLSIWCSRSRPFAQVRSNTMVEQNPGADRTVERTRTNADPCHSCHARGDRSRSQAGDPVAVLSCDHSFQIGMCFGRKVAGAAPRRVTLNLRRGRTARSRGPERLLESGAFGISCRRSWVRVPSSTSLRGLLL